MFIPKESDRVKYFIVGNGTVHAAEIFLPAQTIRGYDDDVFRSFGKSSMQVK